MIVLVGFMGAGKTTVGQLLSERLGLPFADSDLVIEQRAGRPIRQIFAADGEPAFRELERQVVADLIDGPEAVLALGGGAAEHPETMARLKSAQVIYLRVGYEEAMGRVAGDEYRPLLRKPDLDALYQRRLGVYDQVATLTVATDGRRPEAVSRDVLAQLRRIRSATPLPVGRPDTADDGQATAVGMVATGRFSLTRSGSTSWSPAFPPHSSGTRARKRSRKFRANGRIRCTIIPLFLP